MDRIKVMVVDDSVLVRKVVTDALNSDPEIDVVGTANNGKSAVIKNKTLNPDIITMDIEMPLMNGLDALQEIMQENPKPVIMMSVLTQHGADATFKALEYGAVDFIPKPSTMLSMTIEDLREILIEKVKIVARSKIKFEAKLMQVSARKRPVEEKNNIKSLATKDSKILNIRKKFEEEIVTVPLSKGKKESKKIVAIGTSTGGPSALMSIFRMLPENFPSPILVVQHMPEGFTKEFAARLNTLSKITVKEAEDGDVLKPGCGFVAPGHSHIKVDMFGGRFVIKLSKDEKVSGHRPSVDFMFESLVEQCPKNVIAVIMTGMGKDGSGGILHIRENGGYTIAQNEDTSVIYGMNRVAVQKGGIMEIVPLNMIAQKIVEHL